MAQVLFQRISPADFKSLLKKVAIAEKALADLRSELNYLAGIKPSVEYQRLRPDERIHSVLLDDDDWAVTPPAALRGAPDGETSVIPPPIHSRAVPLRQK